MHNGVVRVVVSERRGSTRCRTLLWEVVVNVTATLHAACQHDVVQCVMKVVDGLDQLMPAQSSTLCVSLRHGAPQRYACEFSSFYERV